LGVVEAEAGMVAGARSAATAAIRERKRTQGHAVLCTERGHKSLLKVEFWDCLQKKAQAEACATDKKQRRQDAGGTKQKRPGLAGAQYTTGILYRNGNRGQVKKLGAKEREIKTRSLPDRVGIFDQGRRRRRPRHPTSVCATGVDEGEGEH
jgi:hypothetical protein